jgi:4'-phosphopantetheinyl transferase
MTSSHIHVSPAPGAPLTAALPGEPARPEVHVWSASLERDEAVVQHLYRTLSADEQSRAARFHFARDRRRFCVARGVLRHLLAGYLSAAPAEIGFDYSPRGKPALQRRFSAELRFNVSHSHEMAVYAFARGREVGIDIEQIRTSVEFEQIAQRYFAPSEYQSLRSLPTALRARGFFNCWTRKEAYIKALGDGLSHPLDQFTVSLAPDQPARLLHDRADPTAPHRWTLHAPTIHPEYVVALIAEGSGWQPRIGRWAPDW